MAPNTDKPQGCLSLPVTLGKAETTSEMSRDKEMPNIFLEQRNVAEGMSG